MLPFSEIYIIILSLFLKSTHHSAFNGKQDEIFSLSFTTKGYIFNF